MTASLQRFLDGLTVATVATTVVDVALVYYLIYRLLLTIRGTRAAQMVVGIVLVGAAFFVAERARADDRVVAARQLHLATSSSSSSSCSSRTSGARSAGSARTCCRSAAGRRPRRSSTRSSRRAAQLARARMGAIIVFERDAALEEFVDDATRIDAALSRQLLVSLFVPAKDNELHDGAVVIGKNHRIELARALLPLSRATDLGPEFGTRHRAALGITEDTDAVVVVVSEERGEISLCFKGSIARDLEPVMLRRALVGLFAGGRDRGRWPRRPRRRPRSARRSRRSASRHRRRSPVDARAREAAR